MAFTWVLYMSKEPPSYMMHDPAYIYERETNNDLCKHRTLAMFWIEWERKEPPDSLRHDISLIAGGETMATTWIDYVASAEIPEWMRHAPDLLTKNGTMAMVWVSRWWGHAPPDYMRHSPDIRRKDGKTIADLWFSYFVMPSWMRQRLFEGLTVGCEHVKELSRVTKEKTVVCEECSKNNNTEAEQIFNSHRCGICLELYEKGMEVVLYRPCKHLFCKNCAEDWYYVNKLCPCCKSHIIRIELPVKG
jgi:hypothetical protein